MPPKKIPTHAYYQDKVFFAEPWTRIVDRMFIHYLLEESRLGNWVLGDYNHQAIENARLKLNAQFLVNFEYTFCIGRARRLHKRYKVFSWLIGCEGVEYHPNTQRVYCSDETWHILYDIEQLAAAYRKEGEASFGALKILFGPPQVLAPQADVPLVGVAPHREIIQISSDTENLSTDDSSVVEVHPDSDSGYSSLHSSDYSSLDTDNSFWDEHAWMHHDTASEDSRQLYDPNYRKENPQAQGSIPKSKKNAAGPSSGPPPEEQSSTASWSPLKKH